MVWSKCVGRVLDLVQRRAARRSTTSTPVALQRSHFRKRLLKFVLAIRRVVYVNMMPVEHLSHGSLVRIYTASE